MEGSPRTVSSNHRLQSDGGISEVGSADLRSSQRTSVSARGGPRGKGSHGNVGSCTHCNNHPDGNSYHQLGHSRLVSVQVISEKIIHMLSY